MWISMKAKGKTNYSWAKMGGKVQDFHKWPIAQRSLLLGELKRKSALLRGLGRIRGCLAHLRRIKPRSVAER